MGYRPFPVPGRLSPLLVYLFKTIHRSPVLFSLGQGFLCAQRRMRPVIPAAFRANVTFLNNFVKRPPPVPA